MANSTCSDAFPKKRNGKERKNEAIRACNDFVTNGAQKVPTAARAASPATNSSL
jgi:hypothetical protein